LHLPHKSQICVAALAQIRVLIVDNFAIMRDKLVERITPEAITEEIRPSHSRWRSFASHSVALKIKIRS